MQPLNFVILLAGLAVAPARSAQQAGARSPDRPSERSTFLAADRSADTRAVLSALLRLETSPHAKDAISPHLVADSSIVVPGPSVSHDSSADSRFHPRSAIRAPEDRASDMRELLEDYGNHSRELIHFRPSEFDPDLGVRLLNPVEVQQHLGQLYRDYASRPYRSALAWSQNRPEPPPFVTGPVQSFSQVYFNAAHTVAMVLTSTQALSGRTQWQLLERRGQTWVILPWPSRQAIEN